MKSKFIYACYIFSKAQYKCQTFPINHFRYTDAFLSQMKCPVFLSFGKYDFSNPLALRHGEKEKFPY